MTTRHRIATFFAALVIINAPLFAKRVDPKNEADHVVIAALMGFTDHVAVFCGDDADMRTCRFFANALSHDLSERHVAVGLFYQPETLVQSFYVPPMLIPFTGVTLRLIEAKTGSHGAVQAYVSGFCFDQDPHDDKSYRLPIWVETESARDTGPLESEEAAAVSKLAHELTEYWDKPTGPSKPGASHAKPEKR